MIVPIVSDKRPIIQVEVNKRKCYFLIDTGSSIGILNMTDAKLLGFKIGSKLMATAIGATGNEMDLYHVKDIDVNIMGIKMYQFVATNIDSIVESIRQATGFAISGIIGTLQINQAELKINLQDRIVTVGYE